MLTQVLDRFCNSFVRCQVGVIKFSVVFQHFWKVAVMFSKLLSGYPVSEGFTVPTSPSSLFSSIVRVRRG